MKESVAEAVALSHFGQLYHTTCQIGSATIQAVFSAFGIFFLLFTRV